jgi:hypothetical protein
MVYLDKSKTLFLRNTNGELVPQEITLELLPDKPKAKIIPLTKGDMVELRSKTKEGKTTTDQDAELIAKHYVDPSYSLTEVPYLKPGIQNAMVIALFAYSTETKQEESQNTEDQKKTGS